MHIMHMHIMHEPLFETLFGTALPKRVVKMRVNRAVNIPASQAGETGSIPATCFLYEETADSLNPQFFYEEIAVLSRSGYNCLMWLIIVDPEYI